MNTLNDALKPCPFCGKDEPLIQHIAPHSHPISGLPDFGGSVTIECRGCNLGFIEETEAEARTVWNTRANTPESSAAQGAMGDEPDAWMIFTQDGKPLWFAPEKINGLDWEPVYRKRQPSDATAQPSAYVPVGYKDEADWLRMQLSEAKTCIKAHQAVIAKLEAAQPRVDLTDEHLGEIASEAFHHALSGGHMFDLYKMPKRSEIRALLANTAQGKP